MIGDILIATISDPPGSSNTVYSFSFGPMLGSPPSGESRVQSVRPVRTPHWAEVEKFLRAAHISPQAIGDAAGKVRLIGGAMLIDIEIEE